MAKKKNTFGKFLAFTTTAAAIGGVCYVFRDKIKESSIYKASVNKLTDIYDKLSDNACNQEEEDFFFDEEDEDFEEAFPEEEKGGREYTSITINSKEEEVSPEAVSPDDHDQPSENDDASSSECHPVSDTASSTEKTEAASNDDLKEIFPEESIPTITFDSSISEAADAEIPASETAALEITGYENDGLSDVSEDPDVLEEQDKLDF